MTLKTTCGIENKTRRFFFISSLLLACFYIQAQELTDDKVTFRFGADLVNAYVWRGAHQTSTAFQPSMNLNVSGFSVAAWGSVPFSGTAKEVDFTVGYKAGGFAVAVTDYWWAGEEAYKYFTYGAHQTEHHFEGSLCYTFPTEKLPLSLSWNTLFAGEDYYKADGKRAYSTYLSTAYLFQIKEIGMEAEVGLTPWEGMYATGFSVVSIGLKAEKEIRITDTFSLPVFTQILANPKRQDMFFVFGLSL